MDHAARVRWGNRLVILVAVALSGCWGYVSDDAKQRFEKRGAPFTVSVFPVRVVRGPAVENDAALAAELAAFLTQEGLATAVPVPAAADFPVEWSANEAKMAQRSAQMFAGRVIGTALPTDYGLLVEILCSADETKVLGVHYYLVEPSGAIADGSLRNSHWEEFEQVRPHDRHGGIEVAKLMLLGYWRRAGPAAASGGR